MSKKQCPDLNLSNKLNKEKMKFMPQIVLLTERETFGKKAGKLALRGEVYYEKKPEVCNNYYFLIFLLLSYNNL